MIDMPSYDYISYDYELQTIHNGFFMSPINEYGTHILGWTLGNKVYADVSNIFGILILTLRGWDDLRGG